MDNTNTLDVFFEAYLECALWADGMAHYSADWSPDALEQAYADCELMHLECAGVGTAAQNGHDFWLTRMGHGAGYWGRGYGPEGDRLTAIARTMGEVYVEFGDDGCFHFSSI